MSIRKQALAGVKWTTAGTIIIAGAGLLKIAVLARFLDKEDFGLMALVTFVLGFMNLFMDMGLTTAILHKQKITRQEYASLYWINVLLSLVLLGLITLISPWISGFYNEPELTVLIPLMGISIIFSALGGQFKTIEQKAMNFKYISMTDTFGAIASLVVGVILAVYGYGVYALVYAALLQYAIANSIYFLNGIQRQGLLIHFNFKEVKPFLKIGSYFTGSQIINYINRDLDILIIGKFFSTEILGGYSLAKELIRRPFQIINPIINRITVSIFPKFQNNNASLRSYFMKLFNGMGALNSFVYGFSAIFAPYLVLMFYGRDFSSIVVYVQLFAIVMYFRSMGSNVGILSITKGRTDIEFYWNILVLLITPPAIILGSIYSIELVIILMGIVQLVLLIPGWYFFYKRLLSLNFTPFFKAHIIPFALAIAVFIFSEIEIENLFWTILSAGLLLIVFLIYGFYTIREFKHYIQKSRLKFKMN